MKTLPILALAAVAGMMLAADANAAQRTNDEMNRSMRSQEMRDSRTGRMSDSMREGVEEDRNVMGDIVSFPGRALWSIVRMPVIITDTLQGERELFDPMPKWREEQLAEGRE